MTDIDAAFMQDIFNLAEAERIANVIYNHQADDFRRSLEIFEGVLCYHSEKLGDNQWDVQFV